MAAVGGRRQHREERGVARIVDLLLAVRKEASRLAYEISASSSHAIAFGVNRHDGQNQSFAASCTTRGSRAEVIVPKLAAPRVATGAPKFTVFSRLKTSTRSSTERSRPTGTRRIIARSTSRYDGPRTGLREADPIVNWLAMANAAVLNQ